MSHDPGSEFVDVIDDGGHTIGTVTRREMRARRLPHRSTCIFVFNPRGEIFIHLRTTTKDVFPGHWDVAVGGVLGAGESYDVGAQREVQEELGVDMPLDPLFLYRYEDAANVVQAMAYRGRHHGPFRLQAEEIVRGEFVPLDDVAVRAGEEAFCPDGLAILAEYRRRYTT
jgi:isopentenyldiphosphate isomerase